MNAVALTPGQVRYRRRRELDAERAAEAQRIAVQRMASGLDVFGRDAAARRADLVAALRMTLRLVREGDTLADAYRTAAQEYRTYSELRAALGLRGGDHPRVREDREAATAWVTEALAAQGEHVRRRGPVVTMTRPSEADIARLREQAMGGAR